MKIFLALIVSLCALGLGGCVEQPLVPDEDYNAMHGPAPHSPDPSVHIQPGSF